MDFLLTYKGWRHIKGLPVNGQRTWSNGNTSYKNNTILRDYKSNILKNSYKNIQQQNISTIYLAEQVNLLWKNQWEEEWKEAKKKRLLIQKNNKSFSKIDLSSLASANVNFFSKKKKIDSRKNIISLGFDPGFTKNILKNSSILEKNNILMSSDSNKIKKKKPLLKQTQKASSKIKKKESSWS